MKTKLDFLKEKNIVNNISDDFPLNLSRDCHITTMKLILEVMDEYAKQAFEAGKERDGDYSPYSKYLRFEDYLISLNTNNNEQ